MALELDRVRSIAERVAASHGLDLVDIEFRGGGQSRMLRIFIDKPAGVSHDDCASVSREVSTILDVEDAVSGGSYVLEVSSPGLDRKLVRSEDFARFVGSVVKLVTRDAIAGNRFFQGRLESFADGRLVLDLSGPSSKRNKASEGAPSRKIEIALANIERANLVPQF
jgi:ribosome maturation factor RimP